MAAKTKCDECYHYLFDDDSGCYCCSVALDEDEMGRFLEGTFRDCPYFQFDDEYKTVRRQN